MRPSLACLLLGCALLLLSIAQAQVVAEQPQEAETEESQPVEEPRTLPPPSKEDQDKRHEDPIPGANDEQEDEWIDGVQRGVTSTVDATARWVDRFFGDPRSFDNRASSERAQSVGRLSVGPEWDQADGWRLDSSLRARFYLPHAENRLSAVVGRFDFDEFLAGDDTTRPSLIRSPEAENEWLIGLGYDPVIRDRRRLSLGAGFRGGLRFDPYVRARYLVQTGISERSQLRWQSIGFWRDSDGFGVAQRLDYELGLGEQWLGRWGGRATYAERTEGVRWDTSSTLYYLATDHHAWAGEVWARGETDSEVTVSDYGIRGIYRQRYLREWFFIEPWIGMHWPRESLQERRSAAWIVGMQFEVIFGEALVGNRDG